MRHYSVHQPAWAPHTPDAVRFVKEGFSWPAFFFTGLWLLWKRLWIEFLIFLAVIVGFELVFQAMGVGQALGGLGSLVVGLILGFEGNDLVRAKLARTGYVEISEVAGRDLESAELKYFEGRGTSPPATGHAAP
jgi:hypothetical protein